MTWVCLKIVYPYTQWLMIIIPTKWLFHWGCTPFSDKPTSPLDEWILNGNFNKQLNITRYLICVPCHFCHIHVWIYYSFQVRMQFLYKRKRKRFMASLQHICVLLRLSLGGAYQLVSGWPCRPVIYGISKIMVGWYTIVLTCFDHGTHMYNRWVLHGLYTTYVEVSWNRGTPKSSILIGFSMINHPFCGMPIVRNPPCSVCTSTRSGRCAGLKRLTAAARWSVRTGRQNWVDPWCRFDSSPWKLGFQEEKHLNMEV